MSLIRPLNLLWASALSIFLTAALPLLCTLSAEARIPSERPFTFHSDESDRAKSLYGTRKVVLTFDDGPSFYTLQILDLLKKYNVKATFFVMGNKVTPQTVPIIRRIVEEGHLLGGHLWEHRHSSTLSDDDFTVLYKKSMSQAERINVQFGGNQYPLYFRLPYAQYNESTSRLMMNSSKQIFGKNCVNQVYWDITAFDWLSSMDSKSIYDVVMYQLLGGTNASDIFVHGFSPPGVTGGGIILFHDGISLEEAEAPPEGLRTSEQVQNTVDAVAELLESAEKFNIQIVPLSDVEEYKTSDPACRNHLPKLNL